MKHAYSALNIYSYNNISLVNIIFHTRVGNYFMYRVVYGKFVTAIVDIREIIAFIHSYWHVFFPIYRRTNHGNALDHNEENVITFT